MSPPIRLLTLVVIFLNPIIHISYLRPILLHLTSIGRHIILLIGNSLWLFLQTGLPGFQAKPSQLSRWPAFYFPHFAFLDSIDSNRSYWSHCSVPPSCSPHGYEQFSPPFSPSTEISHLISRILVFTTYVVIGTNSAELAKSA